MITYKAKSLYVDRETGEIITKKNAERNYLIHKTTKKYINDGITEHNGYKFGEITIQYTRECEKRKQLKLF